MGADHQHFVRAVENQGADGGQRRMGFLKVFRRRFEAQMVLLQNAAQFAEMLDDQIRLRRAQLLQRVVAGEHGTGMDPAVMRGLDVVLHVADEQRLVRAQMIFGEDFVNFFPLVPNVRVGLVEVSVESGDLALRHEMIVMHRAQKKSL